jgi:hypothetical protein
MDFSTDTRILYVLSHSSVSRIVPGYVRRFFEDKHRTCDHKENLYKDFIIIDTLVSKRQKKITLSLIKEAEKKYSSDRFNALIQEWQNIYTNLREIALHMLKYSLEYFKLQDLLSKLEDAKLEILTSENENDKFFHLAKSYDTSKDELSFLKGILNIFYKIGLVGFKFPSEKLQFYYDKNETNLPDEQTKIYVHKMFHSYFNVRPLK